MAKTSQSPSSVLLSLMDEYQQNPYSLAKAIQLSPSAVRQIVTGKSKVSVPSALRLAKFFGKTPEFWLDLQRAADLNEAENDKELTAILQGISKVQKPAAKAKTVKKTLPAKSGASSKKDADVKGSKPAARKPRKAK